MFVGALDALLCDELFSESMASGATVENREALLEETDLLEFADDYSYWVLTCPSGSLKGTRVCVIPYSVSEDWSQLVIAIPKAVWARKQADRPWPKLWALRTRNAKVETDAHGVRGDAEVVVCLMKAIVMNHVVVFNLEEERDRGPDRALQFLNDDGTPAIPKPESLRYHCQEFSPEMMTAESGGGAPALPSSARIPI